MEFAFGITGEEGEFTDAPGEIVENEYNTMSSMTAEEMADYKDKLEHDYQTNPTQFDDASDELDSSDEIDNNYTRRSD